MEACVMASITSLISPKQMEMKLNGVVSAKRLLELAEAGACPHYTVDGEIMFGRDETKEWVNHNMVVRHPGKHLGDGIISLVNVLPPAIPCSDIPIELRVVAGSLIPMSLQSAEMTKIPGVYFLCSEGKVVYVGQSGNVGVRVGQHFGAKSFDTVFFIRVAPSDLDDVEGALIRKLTPKYNFSKDGRLIAPLPRDKPNTSESTQLLGCIQDE
jgi:hypothetical protein